MATFLNLTNELLRRTNDTQLSAADFASARNVQAVAKDAVNSAIRFINQAAWEWPWNHDTATVTMLTDGTREYALESDMQQVDWHSFRILNDDANNITPQRLEYVELDDYRQNYRDIDDDRASGSYAKPSRVYRTQNLRFGVTPTPDKAYQVYYEYWKLPADLVAAADTPGIPTQFDYVILDGASMYAADFRSNNEMRQFYQSKFTQGIKVMRDLYISRSEYVRSTVLNVQRGNTLWYV